MELMCLAYKPQHSDPEPIPENMQGVARTASSFLHSGYGIPGRVPNGMIDPEVFFAWISKVRELAKAKDRLAVTDLTIGGWLSDWPCKKDSEIWPDPVIAKLLDQDDCEDIRCGFSTGVRNSRGVSSRMPYDGGDQERKIANKFKVFTAGWRDQKPNLAAMIEDIAESFEREAKRHDDNSRWKQES